MLFPDISTPSLYLTEIKGEHRDDLYEIFSDSDVTKYYDLDAFTDPSQSDKLISLFHRRYSEGLGIRWGIFQKGKGKSIGTRGFNNWSKPMRSATIGYELNKSYWGKGMTTEALAAIIKLTLAEK